MTAKGHTLIDRELYLPFAWTEDPQRCQEASIPASVRFQTKPELAVQMIERIFQAQIPIAWVVADSVYGGNLDLRTWLEALLLHDQQWQRLSMSEGTKGPRLFDWACIPMLHRWEDDGRHWLLIRRSLSDPREKTYYFVFAPPGTTLCEMVQAIGARWHIEQDFETTKDMGLDQYARPQLDRVVSPYHAGDAGPCVLSRDLREDASPWLPLRLLQRSRRRVMWLLMRGRCFP